MTICDAGMSPLLEGLALDAHAPDDYVGMAEVTGWDRVFGGTIVAQALMAAYETIDARLCHSLHAYFLLTGDPARPIHYRIERLRDGGSFSLRRIDVLQDERRIAFVTASFQRVADGPAQQAARWSAPPPPDRFGDNDRRGASAGILLRNVDGLRGPPAGGDLAVHRMWCRSEYPLADLKAHQIAFAYASDFAMLPAILKPLDVVRSGPGLAFASLDHCIWFHRPFDFADWLLCDIRTSMSHGERGHASGGVFTPDGTLVATLAQEGFLRAL